MASILLVNDEADLVEVCEMVLEEAGHEVESLTNANRAAAHASRMRPDLVILDWVTKKSSGEEVLRRLRLAPATAKVPVLMVSALADGHVTAKLYGLDGFLRKPFKANELVGAVDAVLQRSPHAHA
jgi:DNA-binding response OmpR family regulator